MFYCTESEGVEEWKELQQKWDFVLADCNCQSSAWLRNAEVLTDMDPC